MSVRVRRKVLALSLSAVIASSTILANGVASAHEVTIASVQSVTATPTASAVLVNGEQVAFQAFNINSNNYFKLRDIAFALNNTEKSFSVGWDGERNAISLELGKPYLAVGGELDVPADPKVERGVLSTSTIYLDGKAINLTAYTINGNNYFKLRDLGDALNFGVTWDGALNTIRIDSNQGYVAEGQAETPPVKEEIKEEQKGQKQVVRGVEVDYGRHAYGIRSQAEYDEVMQILRDKVADLDNLVLNDRFNEHYHRYLNGEDRKENYVEGTMDYIGYTAAEKLLQPYLDLGLDGDKTLEFYKLKVIASNILNDARVTRGTNSLADLILRGEFDCDPRGYLFSALYDIFGYNTATIVRDNHAFGIVEINGEWIVTSNLSVMNSHSNNQLSSYQILEQPTDGSTLK